MTRASVAAVLARALSPDTAIRPSVGASRPTASARSVVLPEPFGPTRPTTDPAGTACRARRRAVPEPHGRSSDQLPRHLLADDGDQCGHRVVAEASLPSVRE